MNRKKITKVYYSDLKASLDFKYNFRNSLVAIIWTTKIGKEIQTKIGKNLENKNVAEISF